jgi:hypothetical protein
VAAFNSLIFDTAGSYTLTASDGALTSGTSTTFAIGAGSAARLAFSQQPSNSLAGTAIGPAVAVQVQDRFGNFATSDTSKVSMTISSGPGACDGTSTLQVTAINGVASFSNLILDTAGSYSLSAADGSLTAASSMGFAISASSATQLAFKQQPANSIAGSPSGPATTVAVEDKFGNILTNDTSILTLATHSGPGSFDSSSITQVQAMKGLATFSNLILDTTGSYIFSTTAGSLTAANSTNVLISASTPTQLAFGQLPANAIAGIALSPGVTVAAEDKFGNVATGDQSMATIAIHSGPGAFAHGTLQVAAVNGVATFRDLILDVAGSYSLAVQDRSLPFAISSSFAVNATSPSQLAFTQQPSDSAAGTAIAPAVVVAAEDQFGNVVASDTSVATIAIMTGPGAFDSSTTQVNVVNGVATFDNLILDTAGSYTLEATDGTLSPATSTSVLVSAADASQLVFREQPSPGTTGVAISPAIDVVVEDRFGNLIADDTSIVTMTVETGPGKFDDASTTQVAAVNGIASFSNLILDASGSYSLTATDGALTAAHTSITVADSSSQDSPAGFVASLYGIVLNRHADAGGLAYWTQLLASGSTRSLIAQGFWGSEEHCGLEVEQDYATYLNRTAEPDGLAFWMAAFASGMDELDIALEFTNSAEYQAENSSALAFVTAVYVDGLGRKPDAPGLAFWENIVLLPNGRATAAAGILTSAEESLHVLDQYYASLLQRSPDNGGEQYWLSILQSGSLTQSAVADEFLASQEFFQKSTSV